MVAVAAALRRESPASQTLYFSQQQQATVIGVAAQLVQQPGNIMFLRDLGMINGCVQDRIDIGTF